MSDDPQPATPSKIVNWFNRFVAPRITALGFTPRTVTLEVLGRRSGKRFRMSVSPARVGGKDYLVSIFGERSWVRNVRAANGRAWIIHGRRRPVQLTEVPVEQRPPILLAYVSKRAFSRSPSQAAKMYFGLENPTLQDFKPVAEKYPVFLVEPRG